MKNYYASFVQKNSGNLSVSEVSKVSKGGSGTFDTALSVKNPENFTSEVQAAVETSPQIINCLNALISRSVRFKVSPEKFYVTGNLETIAQADADYLNDHYGVILCHLQQSLLTKEVFNVNPKYLEVFQADIAEREAVMELNNGASFDARTEAILDVTKSWIEWLLTGVE